MAEIKKLKIGDTLYKYESMIFNRNKLFLDYHFFKITEETKSYWILNGGCYMARKSDLKMRGCPNNWRCFKVMDSKSIEMQKQQIEYKKNRISQT